MEVEKAKKTTLNRKQLDPWYHGGIFVYFYKKT